MEVFKRLSLLEEFEQKGFTLGAETLHAHKLRPVIFFCEGFSPKTSSSSWQALTDSGCCAKKEEDNTIWFQKCNAFDCWSYCY